jgi:3',5'-cyclic AMP phosphodiesterase CpdA
MTAFKLAHLSDPHLPPLPAVRLRELAGKRVLGYLNWKRNRHAVHRRDMLETIVADMQTQHPDHIAITGDLVNLALPGEFASARAWLESVGPPDRVTLVPGNHDAYVRSTQHLHSIAWADYLRGDGAEAGGAVSFPYVRRRGPVTLIAASTAVPTAPLMATGTLGSQQLGALDKILTQLSTENIFRVLLIHHPLRSEKGARHKRLTDSDDLLALLERHGVELVLHGHDHVHSTMWFDGPNGRIPAIGVPSASALAHGHYPAATYNLFSIEREGGSWHCEQSVRGIDEMRGVSEIKRVQLF